MCQMEMYLVLVTSGQFPRCSARFRFDYFNNRRFKQMWFSSFHSVSQLQLETLALAAADVLTKKKKKLDTKLSRIFFPHGTSVSHTLGSADPGPVTAPDLRPGTAVLTRQPSRHQV